jgi:16S rRNA (adenine1518-N6/adenine1519-N6)-dimethyltransferase
MNDKLAVQTKDLLKKYNLRPKKRFGQNFLVDERIVLGIITAAQLTPADTVVEIGPGLGSLTAHLVQRAGQVLAVEVDRSLIPPLKEKLASYPGFRLLEQDILKVNLDLAVTEAFGRIKEPYKVVANLPYYITTPILMRLLEEQYQISTMILMMQKEVGERLRALPGTKDYGALSVAVQYYTEPELVLKVPPSSFKPAPEVESVVMKLTKRPVPAVTPLDEKLFFQVVRASFGQRRKTLTNGLASVFTTWPKSKIIDLLDSIHIDPGIRGEQLGLVDFAKIADAFYHEQEVEGVGESR